MLESFFSDIQCILPVIVFPGLNDSLPLWSDFSHSHLKYTGVISWFCSVLNSYKLSSENNSKADSAGCFLEWVLMLTHAICHLSSVVLGFLATCSLSFSSPHKDIHLCPPKTFF